MLFCILDLWNVHIQCTGLPRTSIIFNLTSSTGESCQNYDQCFMLHTQRLQILNNIIIEIVFHF